MEKEDLEKLKALYEEIESKIDFYVRASCELSAFEYKELEKLFGYEKALESIFQEKGIEV